MSYYYNYFIGYMHDGKIFPLGPYDAKGNPRDAGSRSRSFASDLHEDFYIVRDEMISDELRKIYEYNSNSTQTGAKTNSLNSSAGTSGTCGIKQGPCNKSDQRCGLTALWRSISEADCLAHYQKGDGANPSSAISVIEDLTKKEDAKNADPDPGFHHLVRNGKKRGNSMGEPVRAEVVLCE